MHFTSSFYLVSEIGGFAPSSPVCIPSNHGAYWGKTTYWGKTKPLLGLT